MSPFACLYVRIHFVCFGLSLFIYLSFILLFVYLFLFIHVYLSLFFFVYLRCCCRLGALPEALLSAHAEARGPLAVYVEDRFIDGKPRYPKP